MHVITGLATGGAEMMLARLAARLQGQFDQTVISLTGGGPVADLLANAEIPVESLGMSVDRPNPLLLVRLVRRLRSLRPDVVQTWLYHADLVGGVAARLAGIRALVWNIRSNDLAVESTKSRTRWVVSVCAHLSRAVPARIVSCSQAAIDTHVKGGYCAERFLFIPNGFDLSRLHPDPGARRRVLSMLDLPADARLIGKVARFDPQKDHQTFFRAAVLVRQAVPQARFVLAGRDVDQDNPAIAAWLDEYRLRDVLHVLGERRDIPEITAALDVACSASAWGEAFPNVLAEAMACQVPCVSTDAGDARLIIGDTGWIVPRRDPKVFAAALIEALLLPVGELAERGRRARERVETHFDLELSVRRYAELYRALASGGA